MLVSNTLELLDEEIPKLKNEIKSVQLCFTTDPFMYEYNEIHQMSIDAIRKLNAAGIKCVILTKGILPDSLAELSDENEYGITLITLDEEYRKKLSLMLHLFMICLLRCECCMNLKRKLGLAWNHIQHQI